MASKYKRLHVCTDGKIATVFLSHRNNRKKMESCLEPVVSFSSTVAVLPLLNTVAILPSVQLEIFIVF